MDTAYTPIWAAAAAALMVSLRCAPAALPGALVARHARLFASASRAAVGLALAYALFQLLQADRAGLTPDLVFAAGGLAVFVAFLLLPA